MISMMSFFERLSIGTSNIFMNLFLTLKREFSKRQIDSFAIDVRAFKQGDKRNWFNQIEFLIKIWLFWKGFKFTTTKFAKRNVRPKTFLLRDKIAEFSIKVPASVT